MRVENANENKLFFAINMNGFASVVLPFQFAKLKIAITLGYFLWSYCF